MSSVVRALFGALLVTGCSEPQATMVVREIGQDLVRAGDWTVLEAHDDAAPASGVITPSIDALVDAADRTSLVLAPPSAVELTIAQTGVLRSAAGVDLSLARALVKLGQPLDVRFTVELNGRTVFDETVTTSPKRARDEMSEASARHTWHPVGGADGLSVRSGDKLVLRTSFPEPPPAELPPVRAGFSELLVEHEREVPRTRSSLQAPNLVLIVMDTLRADRTSTFGYERPTTPALSALAERGTRYERAYASSSWTWPSTASLFTGLPPAAHGVEDYQSCQLAHELDTLAETLQRSGFTTAAFSGNPLISPLRNFDQGFETFDSATELRMSPRVVPQALEWLAARGDTRFFLYLHLVDPHSPHEPRREDLKAFCGTTETQFAPDLFDQLGLQLLARPDTPSDELVSSAQREWLSNVYDASVATGDYWLGQVIAMLADLGLSERTIVAFTSDHGEELFDHDKLGHSHSLHEELVRVPMVLAGPGVPVGGRVTSPVTNRALSARLAELVGTRLVQAPAPLPFESSSEDAPVFTSTAKGLWKGKQFQRLLGLRDGDWLLHWRSADERDLKLYDLSNDPHALHDVAAQHPERAAAMRDRLTERRARLALRRPRSAGAGAATMEVLRAMGYAGDEDEQ